MRVIGNTCRYKSNTSQGHQIKSCGWFPLICKKLHCILWGCSDSQGMWQSSKDCWWSFYSPSQFTIPGIGQTRTVYISLIELFWRKSWLLHFRVSKCFGTRQKRSRREVKYSEWLTVITQFPNQKSINTFNLALQCLVTPYEHLTPSPHWFELKVQIQKA